MTGNSGDNQTPQPVDNELEEMMKDIIHIGYVAGFNQLAQMAGVAPYNHIQPLEPQEAKARLLQWGTRQRLDERQKITYPKLNGYKDFSSHADWSKAQFWEAPITIMQEENRERTAELQASLKDGGNGNG